MPLGSFRAEAGTSCRPFAMRAALTWALVNDAETRFFGVQSEALSKRSAIGLGLSLEELRSDWWVITVDANSDAPRCYVLALDDVRRLASRDKGGEQRYWLEPRGYEQDEYREAWHRIGLLLAWFTSASPSGGARFARA